MNMNMYYMNEPSTIEGIMTLIGILPISFLLTFICITQVNRLWFDKYLIEDVVEEPERKYEDKYPLERAEVSDDPERKVNENSYVLDYTPKGIICMRYDYDSESFLYWCNKKQVPYQILETVARKYVTSYSCKEIYIDKMKLLKEKKELYDEKERQLKEQEEMKKEDKSDAEDTDSENSVFATFKEYNKPVTARKTNKFINVCERANSFLHKGSVNDFEFIQTKHSNIVDTRPKLDFETFKRLFAESNNISETQADNIIENENEDANESTLDNKKNV